MDNKLIDSILSKSFDDFGSVTKIEVEAYAHPGGTLSSGAPTVPNNWGGTCPLHNSHCPTPGSTVTTGSTHTCTAGSGATITIDMYCS